MTRPAAANTRACLRRLKPPAGPHTYVPTLARSLAAKSTTWTRGVCVCVCVCARAPQYRAASWTRGRWPPRRWGPPPRCPDTHTHTFTFTFTFTHTRTRKNTNAATTSQMLQLRCSNAAAMLRLYCSYAAAMLQPPTLLQFSPDCALELQQSMLAHP